MADILKQDTVWIEGRCYRVSESAADLSHFQEYDLYENESMHNNAEGADDGDDDFEITALDNGRFSTMFHIPQHYLGSVIGKKAIVKRKIESDTRTEIRIPKAGLEGDVVVLGASASNVKAARRRIDTIVMWARSKQRPTHFISIPLNSSEITHAVNKFKEEILQEKCDRGLEEDMFISAAKMHLTLCMLCLMDNEERLLASKLLTEARDRIILPALRSAPLHMRMKGVSYMNDDPHEVRVLYGMVEEVDSNPGRLQKLADDVLEFFVNSGFGKCETGRDRVKLHMTLINAKKSKGSAEDEEEGASKRKSWSKTFDAARILEKYADYVFGEQQLTEMHLSQLDTVGPDGYYQSTCIISCTDAGLQ